VKEIRILLADDRALIRGGIRALLEKLPGLQIVAEAGDGPEALRLIREQQPDVALIGSGISELNGFDVTARVTKECPSVNVVVLSVLANDEELKRALRCGAAGYLTLTASAVELELAIRTVAEGTRYVSSAATKLLVDGVLCRSRTEALTPRQQDVLKLIAEGNSLKQIALVLKISVKTVESHRMLLAGHLDIHDTAGLVRYAIKVGLIELEN
jgi:DNA-binding NarL/FixJ family response regulator